MPPLVTRSSYLTVNSLALSTPAYWITNLDGEMLRGATVRGTDTIIPHADGVYPNRRRRTAKLLQFQMVITGDYANDGTPASNYRSQLTTNVEILTAGLGIANGTGAGTVTATWTRWNASTLSAAVHVLGLETEDLAKRHVSAVLEISVPAGVFA